LSTPRLAVIVPAYNEESRLPKTLQRLHEYLSAQPYSWSVVVVSDGSADSTVNVVTTFAREHPHFAVIDSQPNRGKGFAVRRGMLDVDAEYLLLSDADLAAPIEEIEKLWPSMHEEKAVAIGSRPLKDSKLEIRQPWYREFAGRSFNKAVQLLAIRGIQDTQCGFKLFTKSAAQDIFSRCEMDGFSYDFEALMIARDLNIPIYEIPIRWAHQEGSKVSLVRDGTRMLLDLVRLRLKGSARRLAIKP
jgi:dolichyl-phosphate beta-glucosyltransferase